MRLDIYEEELSGLPAPRKLEVKKETKANSKRAELIERTLQFLGPYKGKPRNPKVFAIKVSFLKEDDLEYMLSVAKAWTKNGPALYFKLLKQATPK